MDESQIKKIVEDELKDSFVKKIGDTPTDALQLVPKKYMTDANLAFTDVTTNNVSTTQHGFAPKLPNDATKFLDGTGAYSVPTPTVTQITQNYTAGSAINVGDAVSADFYQATKIAFDAKLATTQAGTGSYSQAFTVGNHANRILIVYIAGQANNTAVTSLQYGGVAMTTVDTGSARGACVSYLVAPATGSNNLTFSAGTDTYNIVIYSYYNAAQSLQPNQHNVNNGGTATITNASSGTLLVGFIGNATSAAITPGGNFNQENTSTVANWVTAADTGVMVPSVTINASGGNGFNFLVAITPFDTLVYGASQASSATGLLQNNLSTGFLGFAKNTVSAGGTVTVILQGQVSINGLTAFSKYYLNDTAGTIGTSVGTITKQVGVSTSNNTLLITNI